MSSQSVPEAKDDPRDVVRKCEAGLSATREPLDDAARAATLVELGWAYRCLDTGDRGENLRRAIRCFDAALGVYSPESHPWEWGRALYRRGVAWAELPDSEDEGLREAIACFTRALAAHTRERYPERWARLHGKLGLAHSQLALGDRAADLQAAVGHYELALQHYTRDSDAIRWARIHCNLATALADLSVFSGDSSLLRRGLASLELALTVYRPDAHPVEYARLSRLVRDWQVRLQT